MKTLVVDDNKLIRVILSKLLEDYGQVDVAKSGEQGVESFKAALASPDGPYELVCMDMSMGAGMSGQEALAELRRVEAAARPESPRATKMLVVTSFADRESVMKTKDLCDGYLLKPVAKEKLYEKMALFGFKPMKKEPAPPPEPKEEKPRTPQAAPDAKELEAKVDFANWDKLPILAQRAGLIVAMLPKKAEPGALPSYETMTVESVKHFASVKALSLIARLESDALPLVCGDGVAYLPGKRALVARKGGRVVIADGSVSIDGTLTLQGPVRPGKTDFGGDIVVKGELMSEAHLYAGGSVRIEGNAGACHIRCGGDFEALRINGQGTALVECGGSIKAEYAYSCKLNAKGDISIAKECISSELKSLGSVKGGAFIGGSCAALKSIEIAKAGSPKETASTLRAGIDFELEDKIAHVKARIAKIDGELESIQQMLGPYATSFEKALELPEKQMTRILEIVGRKVTLKYGHKPELQEELEALSARAKPNPRAKISVAETLCKGVRIEIGEKIESFPQAAQGPLTITAVSDDARYLLER